MLHQVSSIQNPFLQFIRENLESGLYEMWFDGQFQLFCGEVVDSLYVTAGTPFVANWYRKNCQELFYKAACATIPNFSGAIRIGTQAQVRAWAEKTTKKAKSSQVKKGASENGRASRYSSRSEQLSQRNQASREILSDTRRAHLPEVLAFLQGIGADMRDVSILNVPQVERKAESEPKATCGKSVTRSKTVAKKSETKTENTTFASVSQVGGMDDFLNLMDQMHAEGKITRSFAAPAVPEIASKALPEKKTLNLRTLEAKKVEKTKNAEEKETKKRGGRSRLQDLMAKAMELATPEDSETLITSGNGMESVAHEERGATFTVTRWGYAQSTFDTFVSGASNRTAFTTARGIFQRLGYVSPILFTGGTGTGKTHLLNAIYNHAVALGVSVVYRTCEEFLTDFVSGIRDPRKKAEFEALYRQCDILALDNLQALLGKPKTVLELKTILDYRIRLGKQIVLASDRDLSALAEFGQELCSQLEGGYVCHISEPSYDVRLGILSRESGRRDLALTDAQCQKLAFRYEGDVRAILGALNTLEMKVRTQMQFRPCGEKSTSIQERTAILQQLVEGMASQPGRTIRLEDIKRYVSLLFGIDVPLLSSGKRERKVSQPRMLAMWLARKFTRKSLSEIGQAFGCNSHSTVISAQKKVEQWRTTGYQIQTYESVQSVNELLYQLENQLQRAL